MEDIIGGSHDSTYVMVMRVSPIREQKESGDPACSVPTVNR
jgi:hypothetical protein